MIPVSLSLRGMVCIGVITDSTVDYNIRILLKTPISCVIFGYWRNRQNLPSEFAVLLPLSDGLEGNGADLIGEVHVPGIVLNDPGSEGRDTLPIFRILFECFTVHLS